MSLAVMFYKIFKANPNFSSIYTMYEYLVNNPPFRQPLYPITLMLPFFIFGLSNSYKIALLINGFYFVVTICGIYVLGRNYFSKTASLLASFLFASYGFPLFYLHFTYSETSTTAWVVLALCLIVKSKKFDNNKYSFLAGLAFGGALLTRWIALFFIIGAFVPSFIVLLREKLGAKYFKGIAYFCLGLLPAVIFYGLTSQYFIKDYLLLNTNNAHTWAVKYMGSALYVNSFSPQSFAYYFKVFEQLNIFYFGIFIIGLVVSFIKWRKLYVLLLCFFIPYIALTVFSSLKDDRYIVPIYPVFALISVAFYDYLRKPISKIVFSAVIIFAIFSFLGGVWGMGFMGKEGLASFLLPMPIGHPRRIHLTSMVWPPTKRYSNADIIIDTIDKDVSISNLKNPIIIRLFYFPYFDNSFDAINTYYKQNGYYLNNFVRPEISLSAKKCSNLLLDEIKRSDYIIVKDKRLVDDEGLPPVYYKFLKMAIVAIHKSNYLPELVKIKENRMPFDGSIISIYKNSKKGENLPKRLQEEIKSIDCNKFDFENTRL